MRQRPSRGHLPPRKERHQLWAGDAQASHSRLRPPCSHRGLQQALPSHFWTLLGRLCQAPPVLPCRNVFWHLTTFFLELGVQEAGCWGVPPTTNLATKAVLALPAWNNIQTLSGCKESSFSPKVLNSNHPRPGKVHGGFSL